MSLLRSIWQTITGGRLRQSRRERSLQNAAIKTAIVEGETRRIEELERQIKREGDPRVAKYLKSEANRHRQRLSETEQAIESLGI